MESRLRMADVIDFEKALQRKKQKLITKLDDIVKHK